MLKDEVSFVFGCVISILPLKNKLLQVKHQNDLSIEVMELKTSSNLIHLIVNISFIDLTGGHMQDNTDLLSKGYLIIIWTRRNIKIGIVQKVYE